MGRGVALGKLEMRWRSVDWGGVGWGGAGWGGCGLWVRLGRVGWVWAVGEVGQGGVGVGCG